MYSIYSILALIVNQRLNIWKRSREFYPIFYAVYDKFNVLLYLYNRYVITQGEKCPGCETAFSPKNDKIVFEFEACGNKNKTFICVDCNKDNPNLEKHEGENCS